MKKNQNKIIAHPTVDKYLDCEHFSLALHKSSFSSQRDENRLLQLKIDLYVNRTVYNPHPFVYSVRKLFSKSSTKYINVLRFTFSKIVLILFDRMLTVVFFFRLHSGYQDVDGCCATETPQRGGLV